MGVGRIGTWVGGGRDVCHAVLGCSPFFMRIGDGVVLVIRRV